MDDKKFVKPEAEIVDYTSDDIITMSVGTAEAGWDGEEFQ